MNWDFFDFTDYKSFIFWGFALFFLIQIIYYWLVFGLFAFRKNKTKTDTAPNKLPISVVIAAKDEYYNLEKNLPLILEQEYPDFEVIVVNDCSSDESDSLLKQLKQKYPHLVNVQVCGNYNKYSGKKFPLSLGIKSAKNDYLILTDADCQPKSKLWLKSIQHHFSEGKEIVLGYGAYEYRKGFLNKIIRFDTFYIALQYFSMALLKMPYMGVGRNLAYKRDLFIKNKGFTSHYNVMSGDDDLFINQISNKRNTAIEFSHQSHTVSAPKEQFGYWLHQKRRHLTTGVHYKFKHKFLLGLFSVSRFGFYGGFLSLLILSSFIEIAIAAFVLRMITQIIVFKKSMNKLDEKNLLLISLLLDFIFVIINTTLITSNFFFRANKWK